MGVHPELLNSPREEDHKVEHFLIKCRIIHNLEISVSVAQAKISVLHRLLFSAKEEEISNHLEWSGQRKRERLLTMLKITLNNAIEEIERMCLLIILKFGVF